MSKKISLIVTAVFLTTVSIVRAQPQNKVARIGYLDAPSAWSVPLRAEAFRQGLRELGYVEGKNIIIEYRYAEGKLDRLPALAAELVRLKVDVIVTGGATVTRAVMKETTTIPIVMAQDPDPVGNGFVAGLARPGGNVTGLSSLTADLSGKRLELLKEILPKFAHVAILGTSTNPANAQQRRETELAAAAFKVKVQYLDVLSAKNIEPAFRAASKERADGIVQLSGPVLSTQITQIPKLAISHRLPVFYDRAEFVNEGGLMSYGANRRDLDRRAATYVDKILKGAKPGEIPVEQPTKFDFVINLKAAKQIGLTIPPQVLAPADRVIR